MKYQIIILFFAFITLTLNAQTLCPNQFKCGDTLVDSRDGYHYPTVKIGTQCWFAKNLYATKYLNGDAIPNITNQSVWDALTTGAWCDYEENPANGIIYGHMYNWFAVDDNRSICPKGWYVATLNEFAILTSYLGGQSVAGTALKSTTGWISFPGTDTTGFNGLPGGYINNSGFGALTFTDYNWTSTLGWEMALHCCQGGGNQYNTYASLEGPNAYPYAGMSLRCMKEY